MTHSYSLPWAQFERHSALSRRGRLWASFIHSRFLLQKLSSGQIKQKGPGPPFLTQPLLWVEVYCRHSRLRILGSSYWARPHPRRASYLAPPLTEHRCHSERSESLSQTPVPLQSVRKVIPKGEAGLKNRELSSCPKETNFIWNRACDKMLKNYDLCGEQLKGGW